MKRIRRKEKEKTTRKKDERSNKKKTKTTKRKIKKKVCEGRKKNAVKKWEFISTNRKLHPTNKTHNRFHQTNALVGVGSF
jgi:hypothetical protein